MGWGGSTAPWDPVTSDLWHLTSAPPSNYWSAKRDLPAWQKRGQTDQGRCSGWCLRLTGPSLASTHPSRHPWRALSRPHLILGGQQSPSVGLPRHTPHSELKVGTTRFQPQILEATFSLDLAGVQAPPHRAELTAA